MQRESAAPVHPGRHNRHVKFASVHAREPYALRAGSQLALHKSRGAFEHHLHIVFAPVDFEHGHIVVGV